MSEIRYKNYKANVLSSIPRACRFITSRRAHLLSLLDAPSMPRSQHSDSMDRGLHRAGIDLDCLSQLKD